MVINSLYNLMTDAQGQTITWVILSKETTLLSSGQLSNGNHSSSWLKNIGSGTEAMIDESAYMTCSALLGVLTAIILY